MFVVLLRTLDECTLLNWLWLRVAFKYILIKNYMEMTSENENNNTKCKHK